jgi:hypothetical protein
MVRSYEKTSMPSIVCVGGSSWVKNYYFEVEMICYTVIMCSRKLKHYFEAHHIRVLTNQPLHDIFHNQDSSE